MLSGSQSSLAVSATSHPRTATAPRLIASGRDYATSGSRRTAANDSALSPIWISHTGGLAMCGYSLRRASRQTSSLIRSPANPRRSSLTSSSISRGGKWFA
jgi:hypothetical protein